MSGVNLTAFERKMALVSRDCTNQGGGDTTPQDDTTGQTGMPTGWTQNNALRGDEGPGHFPEDEEEDLRDQEPDQNDGVMYCPDCETPNQFGELCLACQRERDAEGYDPDTDPRFEEVTQSRSSVSAQRGRRGGTTGRVRNPGIIYLDGKETPTTQVRGR